MQIILLGNAGAGKSTMARRPIGDTDIARPFDAFDGPKREYRSVAACTDQ